MSAVIAAGQAVGVRHPDSAQAFWNGDIVSAPDTPPEGG
jgi:hypothetical protein